MIDSRAPAGPRAVARHYDALDRFYREIWGEHLHHGLWIWGDETPEVAARQLADRVATRAGVRPGAAVCDVGSGYGATARLLACAYGARVTALTLSPAQYAYARSVTREPSGPTYLLGDWLENGLPAESFDAVIAIESSEHVANKAAFFAEAVRVLRPGGRMVICAWLAAEEPARWHARHLLEPICREGRLPGMGTAPEYAALMAAAGLRVESYEDLTRHVRRTWPACLARTLRGVARNPEYRRFLRDARNDDRIFARTMVRIWCAYAVGAMRYGIFTARRD